MTDVAVVAEPGLQGKDESRQDRGRLWASGGESYTCASPRHSNNIPTRPVWIFTPFSRAVSEYSHRFHVPCVDIHTVSTCRVWIFTPFPRAVSGYSHRFHVPCLDIHTIFTCRVWIFTPFSRAVSGYSHRFHVPSGDAIALPCLALVEWV